MRNQGKDLDKVVMDQLGILFGKSGESANYWTLLKQQLPNKFPKAIIHESRDDLFDLREHVDMLVLCRRIQDTSGTPKCYL